MEVIIVKKILSIDFDCFIDVPIKVRDTIFPDGEDDIPAPKLLELWNECYAEHPDMYDIGLLEENIRILTDKLNNSKFKAMYYADSHKKIWEIISSIPKEEEVFITNIDFHHDNYISGGNSVDCANWVRHLMNRPKSYIEWIAREDSAISSLTGDFPYDISFNIEDVEEEYDYVLNWKNEDSS